MTLATLDLARIESLSGNITPEAVVDELLQHCTAYAVHEDESVELHTHDHTNMNKIIKCAEIHQIPIAITPYHTNTYTSKRDYYRAGGIIPYRFRHGELQLLMGIEWRDQMLSLGWLAGKREVYEDSPEETAVREFWEETNKIIPTNMLPFLLRRLTNEVCKNNTQRKCFVIPIFPENKMLMYAAAYDYLFDHPHLDIFAQNNGQSIVEIHKKSVKPQKEVLAIAWVSASQLITGSKQIQVSQHPFLGAKRTHVHVPPFLKVKDVSTAMYYMISFGTLRGMKLSILSFPLSIEQQLLKAHLQHQSRAKQQVMQQAKGKEDGKRNDDTMSEMKCRIKQNLKDPLYIALSDRASIQKVNLC